MAQLAAAQVASGKVDAGIATYESLFRKSEAAKKSDARWGYYDAMVATKNYNKLELALKTELKEGTREDAARAQIIRGDILMSQGDTQGAAMDYLKTVLLFKKQGDVQPEALYKAGEALAKMKDPRAAEQFKEVVQKYPGSPWAGKAREKL
jgi:TolA-binding protein